MLQEKKNTEIKEVVSIHQLYLRVFAGSWGPVVIGQEAENVLGRTREKHIDRNELAEAIFSNKNRIESYHPTVGKFRCDSTRVTERRGM